MHVSSAGSNDECARIRIAPGGVRSCCPVTGGGGAQLVHLAPARWRYRYKYSDDQTFHFLRTSTHRQPLSVSYGSQQARQEQQHGGTLQQQINILLYCLFVAVTLSSPPPPPGPGTSSPRPGLHRAGLGCGVQAAPGQELDVKNIVYVVKDAQLLNLLMLMWSDVARSRT